MGERRIPRFSQLLPRCEQRCRGHPVIGPLSVDRLAHDHLALVTQTTALHAVDAAIVNVMQAKGRDQAAQLGQVRGADGVAHGDKLARVELLYLNGGYARQQPRRLLKARQEAELRVLAPRVRSIERIVHHAKVVHAFARFEFVPTCEPIESSNVREWPGLDLRDGCRRTSRGAEYGDAFSGHSSPLMVMMMNSKSGRPTHTRATRRVALCCACCCAIHSR